MVKRKGPIIYTPSPRTVCNGCEYLKTSMKLRSMRTAEDYWDCSEPRVVVDGRDKSIGSGPGMTPTPDWCPLRGEV